MVAANKALYRTATSGADKLNRYVRFQYEADIHLLAYLAKGTVFECYISHHPPKTIYNKQEEMLLRTT